MSQHSVFKVQWRYHSSLWDNHTADICLPLVTVGSVCLYIDNAMLAGRGPFWMTIGQELYCNKHSGTSQNCFGIVLCMLRGMGFSLPVPHCRHWEMNSGVVLDYYFPLQESFEINIILWWCCNGKMLNLHRNHIEESCYIWCPVDQLSYKSCVFPGQT